MADTMADDARKAPRSIGALLLFLGLAVLAFAMFCALGVWQVQRLHWKLDLIATVDARLAAAPVAAPAPQDWPALTQKADEYRRVAVTGTYMTGKDTLVKAVTELGSGFWVMTPLHSAEGWTLLVNRGFVPDDRREASDRDLPGGTVTVTGLLRMTQPKGAFLHANRPQDDRWYSRDTAAIAAHDGIGDVAPYFIDAAAGPDRQRLPVGGLTVVQFRNAHLQYALTWFGMALLLAGGIAYVLRQEIRLRR